MKGIAVLGSTGSIGTSTLDVIEAQPDRFRVVTLAAGRNVERLLEQARRHRPKLVAIGDADDAERLRRDLPADTRVLSGPEGLEEAAVHPQVDLVVGGVVGAAGLPSCAAALREGKTLALANKETLVVAGDAMTAIARASGASILPVDSEHNAIHQALRGGRPDEVERIVLTASGGPFRTRALDSFGSITVEDALAHPTWEMGRKISIDSATMMNKGLEVIEAHHLFDLPSGRIDVVIHPQSTIHSMVEFVDGSILAQLSINDMRFPILYALCWPERIPTRFGRLDLSSAVSLQLEPVDPRRYPALGLARAALERGGNAPAVLNAANEVAVEAFLGGRIAFVRIPALVEEVLEVLPAGRADTVDEAMEWDARARREARQRLAAGAPS